MIRSVRSSLLAVVSCALSLALALTTMLATTPAAAQQRQTLATNMAAPADAALIGRLPPTEQNNDPGLRSEGSSTRAERFNLPHRVDNFQNCLET
jgi:hypothetical protein